MTNTEELRSLYRNHRWAFEELVVDQKMQEANVLCGGSGNAMLVYLKERFGSTGAVIDSLRTLVMKQKRPLKSLTLPLAIKK